MGVVIMLKDDYIHIALAFCDPKGTYARHAAVVMASMFENTQAPLCVHIIHDDTLSAFNREKFEATAEAYGQTLDFVNVESLLEKTAIDVSKLTIDGARGTLFRLLIPDLIDAEKLLYLDCDLIIDLDIADFWNAPIDGHALGAVRDVWSLDYLRGEPVPWRYATAWGLMGIEKDSYFNAGVLVMDLKKIREEHSFLQEVEVFYSRYKKCITLADQDCLNHIFAGDVAYLDHRFNRIDLDSYTKDGERSIWHMAGGAKPWTLCSTGGVDELYWHYLTKTAYCRNSDELISQMVGSLCASSFMHRHSSHCIKRLKRQLADNIFRSHIWTIPHMYVMKLKFALGIERPHKR